MVKEKIAPDSTVKLPSLVVVCAVVMTVVDDVVGTGIGWSLNITSPMCTHSITAPEGLWNSRK